MVGFFIEKSDVYFHGFLNLYRIILKGKLMFFIICRFWGYRLSRGGDPVTGLSRCESL